MGKKIKKKTKKKGIAELLILWTKITVVFAVLTISFYYLSPRFIAPRIDETKNITSLPPEMKNVLGSKVDPNYKGISLRVPILMYHYVEYVQDKGDNIRISLNIPPSVFEEQLKTLKEAGYTFLTASYVGDALEGKAELPLKPIVITFDDGYRDFYTDAYPILKKYNAKATQYVIVDFLDRPNHLLTSQLKEIAEEGLVEIGAHTMDHVWLRGINGKTAKYQIEESRRELQSLLGLPIKSFAYPFGAFDNQAIKLVEEAGFTNAVSTIPGIQAAEDNKYFLYRLRPGWRTGQTLLDYLSSDFL